MNPFIYFMNPLFTYLFIAFCSYIFIHAHDRKERHIVDYAIIMVVTICMSALWPVYLLVRIMYVPAFLRTYLLLKASKK